MSYILENGEQYDLTYHQVAALLTADMIYDSGENYYHISYPYDYSDIERFLKGLSDRRL